MHHVLIAAPLVIAAGTACAQPAAGIPAQGFTLDASHTSVLFSLSHLGFSTFTATFDEIDATLTLDPADPEAAALTASIRTDSLDLPAPPEGFRETLLGPDWLRAEAHPEITFVSERIRRTGERTAEIDGTLTIAGIDQPFTLDTVFNGGYLGHPLDPQARIGFSAEGVLSRSAYGMAFGVPPEGSTMGVGDAVTITIEAEFSGTIPYEGE